MKKLFFNFFVIIPSLLFITGCASGTSITNKKTATLDKNWKETQEPFSDTVVCTLKISATAELENEHIAGEINVDNEPTKLTFTDIDSKVPLMIGNLGDKVSLVKIDNGNTIYLIEKTAFNNINVFTLFRDKNVMLMSKQYDFLGTPFGLLMIGDCLSGS